MRDWYPVNCPNCGASNWLKSEEEPATPLVLCRNCRQVFAVRELPDMGALLARGLECELGRESPAE